MEDDIEILYSPLQQCYSKDGRTLDIQIYKGENEVDWVLEVVDEGGTSTIWDEGFPTDKAALEAAFRAIDEEGVEPFSTEALLRYLH